VVNGGNCPWGDVNWVHHVHAADPLGGGGTRLLRLKNRIQARQFLAEERAVIPKARLIVTTCEKTRRVILDRIPGVRPEAVRVVYLGVDPDLFHPASPDERAGIRARLGWPPDRPIALFIGGLGGNRKGFDRLFEAWSSLCREPAWDADLMVVGVGSERPVWEARAAEAGLADRIRFLGSRRDLPELVRACDGHVLPSRYEGYSMVTQEALCCGVPAYITADAGIADRFPDALRDELLIPDPEDAADLAARLRAWRGRLGHPWPELEAFGGQLRRHTWDAMAGRMVELIEETPYPAA
jgi:glycosyltransferase involved in cell wall biosynthesis